MPNLIHVDLWMTSLKYLGVMDDEFVTPWTSKACYMAHSRTCSMDHAIKTRSTAIGPVLWTTEHVLWVMEHFL